MIRFAVLAVAACLLASGTNAQCRNADKPVSMTLGMAGGQVQALVTRRIPVCERHEFKLQVKAGQRIELSLTSPSGQKGMLTFVAPSGDKPADGENEWSGTAKESGTYVVEVGTDKTTTYTLKVVLK